MSKEYTAAQKISQRYLNSIRDNELRMKILESEIELQRGRLSLNGVASGEKVKATISGDSLEQGFIKLYEYCEKLDEELSYYLDERDRALKVVSRLNDPKQYEIVYLRYFKGINFCQIAKLMSFTERNVYKIHLKALSSLYHCLPEIYRKNCSVKFS